MDNTNVFVPYKGEVLRGVDGKAIIRVMPVIVWYHSMARTIFRLLVNEMDPESDDPVHWVSRRIDLEEHQSRALEQPSEVWIEMTNRHEPLHFVLGPDQVLFIAEREDGKEQVTLDARSSSVVRHLIGECHEQTMVR